MRAYGGQTYGLKRGISAKGALTVVIVQGCLTALIKTLIERINQGRERGDVHRPIKC